MIIYEQSNTFGPDSHRYIRLRPGLKVGGEPVEKIRPNDVVWIPPRVKHWHGAAPATAMTHISIQGKLDGSAVEWLGKVSEEQYQALLKTE